MQKLEQDCIATALRLLAIREHSRLELKNKLRKRDYTEEEIQSVLCELQEKNLQSNERFAEAYIHSRQQKGFGLNLIKKELQERGVEKELIARFTETLRDKESKRAKLQLKKKFGQMKPADYAEQVRQMRFLQSRGFSEFIIRSIFDEVY